MVAMQLCHDCLVIFARDLSFINKSLAELLLCAMLLASFSVWYLALHSRIFSRNSVMYDYLNGMAQEG